MPDALDFFAICAHCDSINASFSLTRINLPEIMPEHRWVCRLEQENGFVRGFGVDAQGAFENALACANLFIPLSLRP